MRAISLTLFARTTGRKDNAYQAFYCPKICFAIYNAKIILKLLAMIVKSSKIGMTIIMLAFTASLKK
nr:MAG TPA: hypothetical protein [Caudoviricetes sp.]